MIDSVQELISPHVEQDPTKFCSMEEFEAAYQTWLTEREEALAAAAAE